MKSPLICLCKLALVPLQSPHNGQSDFIKTEVSSCPSSAPRPQCLPDYTSGSRNAHHGYKAGGRLPQLCLHLLRLFRSLFQPTGVLSGANLKGALLGSR